MERPDPSGRSCLRRHVAVWSEVIPTIESSGVRLPARFGDPLGEYLATSQGAALYYHSHTGRLKATGKDALDLFHRLSTNRVNPLDVGRSVPTVITTDRGRIVDLVLVANLGDRLLLLTGAGNAQRVAQWIEKYTIMEEVTVEDISSATSRLTLIGPKAVEVLSKVISQSGSLALYQSAVAQVSGVQVTVLRNDLNSVPGYDLIVSRYSEEAVWNVLIKNGAMPVGEEAFQAMRIELGVPLAGRELTEDYNPLEAGLNGCISFSKGCYIGQEVIARLDTYGKLQRHLVVLHLPQGVDVKSGDALMHAGATAGTIISVAPLPNGDKTVALAYVRRAVAEVGTELEVSGKLGVKATVAVIAQPYGPSKD